VYPIIDGCRPVKAGLAGGADERVINIGRNGTGMKSLQASNIEHPCDK
jgi:hypothetical protein